MKKILSLGLSVIMFLSVVGMTKADEKLNVSRIGGRK